MTVTMCTNKLIKLILSSSTNSTNFMYTNNSIVISYVKSTFRNKSKVKKAQKKRLKKMFTNEL